MNKMASYVQFFVDMGKQAALQEGQTKVANLARLMPKSRMGKATLGLGALGGALAGAKALGQPEPNALENMYEGGKDMLSNMSQEELMGYANLLGQLNQGGVMGYDASGVQADPYSLEDMGGYGGYEDPMAYAPQGGDMMGYDAQMSPEEMQQYMAYYS